MTGYIDFAIDGDDIAYENGKMKIVRKEEEVIQRVKTRLRKIKGEWFLDVQSGMPYYNGQILGAKDTGYARLVIKSQIQQTKGVNDVLALNILINPQTHTTSVYAEIKIDESIYKIKEDL